MKIAFTGTRKGMTPAQQDSVAIAFAKLDALVLHHGACRGADRVAHAILVQTFGSMSAHHMHPTNEEQHLWAFSVARQPDVIYTLETDPIKRNHLMIDLSEALVAAPSKKQEELRSGTWATIRYARKLHKPIYFCWPDGTITTENIQ